MSTGVHCDQCDKTLDYFRREDKATVPPSVSIVIYLNEPPTMLGGGNPLHFCDWKCVTNWARNGGVTWLQFFDRDGGN